MSCFYVSRIRYFQRHLFTAGLYPLIGFSLPEFNHYGFLFPPRDHLSPPGFQYFIKSGDTFVYWVSRKSAFLTLYISQLSFPLRSTSLPPFAVLYFLLTDDACLSISIHCARHAERKMFLLKSCAATSNLTITMGNTERRIWNVHFCETFNGILWEDDTFTKYGNCTS